MFFRFGIGLLLVVLTSLAGTALEKRCLELKRLVSRQYYRMDLLHEQQASRRVQAQQLGAPNRLVDQLGQAESAKASAVSPQTLQPSSHKPRRRTQP